ncbi:MAG: hypothetical protein PHW46_06235 [Candidatus Omnitrophica bacterium]|nr:hypothetical protein [Candidatus Omnitrophota bacterium]
MKLLSIAAGCMFLVMIAGCTEIKAPTPKQIFDNPLGEGSLKIGMSKAHVKDVYGGPTSNRIVTAGEWGGEREEWFYKADYSVLPVGTGYLTEDLYLYFDGDNLTNISREPIGKPVEKSDKNVQ